MNPRSTFRITVILLGALALLVAQTLGGSAGYYCWCGGRPVPTQTAHCAGPHGENCASDEAQQDASTCDSEDGERRDHEVVSQDVQSRPLDAKSHTVAPPLLAVIVPGLEPFRAVETVKLSAGSPVDFGESPPSGITVARTIVLRI